MPNTVQTSSEGSTINLQILAEMISQEWPKHWQEVLLSALDAVAENARHHYELIRFLFCREGLF